MDLATILGLGGAALTVTGAILQGGSPEMFFNIPSILIVIVGSIFVTMVKFNLKHYLSAMKISRTFAL